MTDPLAATIAAQTLGVPPTEHLIVELRWYHPRLWSRPPFYMTLDAFALQTVFKAPAAKYWWFTARMRQLMLATDLVAIMNCLDACVAYYQDLRDRNPKLYGKNYDRGHWRWPNHSIW